jgi:hypothetical protein
MLIPPSTVWFLCKGCGKPAAYFPDGLPPYYAPGAVGHSKAPQLVRERGAPSQVQCALYQQLSVEAYWEHHRDAERLPPPDTTEPRNVSPCRHDDNDN